MLKTCGLDEGRKNFADLLTKNLETILSNKFLPEHGLEFKQEGVLKNIYYSMN